MKNFFAGIAIGLVFVVGLLTANDVWAKTPIEMKLMDRQSFSLIAIKEVRPEGELGVIFVCHKNEDEVRVIPIQPVLEDGTVAKIWLIEIASFDTAGNLKSITPFSTGEDHIWNLRTVFNVMRSPEYKGTYSIRMYRAADGKKIETRKFTDVELKRISKDKRIKGCDNDHMQNPNEWEHAGSVDFSVYDNYN